MPSLQSFSDLIFADAGDHAHYTLYSRTYFTGLIFADSHLSAKTAKIGSHENFPLYGIMECVLGIITHAHGASLSSIQTLPAFHCFYTEKLR
jgi:hypothetical protein